MTVVVVCEVVVVCGCGVVVGAARVVVGATTGAGADWVVTWVVATTDVVTLVTAGWCTTRCRRAGLAGGRGVGAVAASVLVVATSCARAACVGAVLPPELPQAASTSAAPTPAASAPLITPI